MILAGVVALVGVLGCSKPPKSPMAQKMVEIDEAWKRVDQVIASHDYAFSKGYSEEVAAHFRSDVILGSDLYQNEPDFAKWTDASIRAFEQMEIHLAEGMTMDIAISRKQILTLCQNCHRKYQTPG